ncbi:MAG: RDD family protein [Coleofasciculus sp. A1-SPW-01]|uniref:RDD family protein n=1 Tax=Coleofasciculus sp. A1-SPW-01 TaxID=3070819 RepID=UPI0033008700
MNPAKIKQLAKQGNPKAIAALLNRSLQRQGVTAKVGRDKNNLQVILESAQVPPTNLTQRICQGLINLGVESIDRVQIYGRQIGEEIPDWSQDIDLANPTEPTPIETDLSASTANDEPQDLSSFVTSKAKINTHKTSTPETHQVTDNYQNPPQEQEATEPQPSLKPASRTKRFLNYLLDVLFLIPMFFVIGIVVIVVLIMFNPEIFDFETNETTPLEDLIYNLIGYMTFLLYYTVTESLWSKSPGKFITKTKVVTNQDEKPTSGQIFGRTVARYIPFEAFSFLTSSRPRGWHDKVSGTKVVDD